MKWELKAKRISGVLHLNTCPDPSGQFEVKGGLLDFFREYEAVRYALILHDRDIAEDGTEKVPHIHFYAEFPTQNRRLGTYLNAITAATGMPVLSVSLEKCNDPDSILRYLVHKNAPEKYQYPLEEVITNIPQDEYKALLESEEVAFSVDYVLEVWKRTKGKMCDFIREVGMERYRLYRNVIGDILGIRRFR